MINAENSIGLQPAVTVLGGGTGSYTLLKEIKHMSDDVTAVVNMCDNGGSTGVLSSDFDVHATGDIRQCLIALSNDSFAAKVFGHRFDHGELAGHPVGNMFLAAAELEFDFTTAVDTMSRVLDITGRVIPATLIKHDLVVDDGNEEIIGEATVGEAYFTSNTPSVRLSNESEIDPRAEEAILKSDLIVIAPGNMYCSILPIFAVKGVRETLRASKARRVAVTNLVTKPNHTEGWHVVDHIFEMEKYLGKGAIDLVLYNTTLPNSEQIDHYARHGEKPVNSSSERFQEIATKCIGAELLAEDMVIQGLNDKGIQRNAIRHDAKQVRYFLESVLRGGY